MSNAIFRVVWRVWRATLLLFCLPVFAGAPFVGAPEPAKPSKEPPLSAEEQLATFTVPPGFKVELVAAEPDGGKFVAVAFDHAGRMWTIDRKSTRLNSS